MRHRGGAEAAEDAEAQHRGSGGPADEALLASARDRGKQKNLSFFAFTATPKPKTLETFGQVGADGQQAAVPHLLDAPGDRGGVHPRRAGELHDVRRVLQARQRPPAQRPGDGVHARAGPRWRGSRRCTRTSWSRRPRSSSSTSGRRPPARSTGARRRWSSPGPGCTPCARKQALDAYIAARATTRAQRPLRTLVAFSGTVIDPDAPDARRGPKPA